MKKLMCKILIVPIFLCVIRTHAQVSYEVYARFLNDYPAGTSPWPQPWGVQVQGLAHDQDNWFITQTGFDDDPGIWKIPLSHDLDGEATPGEDGIAVTYRSHWPQLSGYEHFGDLDYSEGYLFVPVEVGDYPVAVFRASDLAYICRASLSERQHHVPWCAVFNRVLYSCNYGDEDTPDEHDVKIFRYFIDWARLVNANQIVFTKVDTLNLLQANGYPESISGIQGGEISPDGKLLYLVAGRTGLRDVWNNYGIYVFDLSTKKEILRSTNGTGLFNYEFDTQNLEEPEGMTIWDLDGGSNPLGQLHVLLFDNKVTPIPYTPCVTGWYHFWIKHYTNAIWVDGTVEEGGDGRLTNKYKTIIAANDFAWNGAKIKISAGSYPEALTISKIVKLEAIGGTVTIGK